MTDIDQRNLQDTEQPRGTPAADATPSGCITSSELLRGQSCIHIEHGGGLYTLRATRSGKLILTK